ncbi:comm domain-containing protein [Anaeramoeba ignava]|uniref:COMM domain-containing protein 3 n=1 Tax=Anaeramoeba ignava TaxID=1746090 RepID=A0A9Q0LTE3_ANAIG|nr:comm domain-containing protein [Anaeramoeba ignava]
MFLKEQNLPNEFCTQFIQKYQEIQEAIERSQLENKPTSYPWLKSVKWRMDYSIKSNIVEKIDSPIYFVEFQTNEESKLNEKQKICFSCSVDQLQDLVATLKDATFQVERILQEK